MSGSAPAVIGFIPGQFVVAPTSSGPPFSIAADANDLLVRGTGFTSIMATDFSAGTVQMTVYFKVIEPDTNISLSLKNWLEGTVPCQLTIEINSQPAILRYVDAPETSGGSDNVTVVALRYMDFTSVNYCDDLQMGLNQVSITITPTASTPATSYQLLAMLVHPIQQRIPIGTLVVTEGDKTRPDVPVDSETYYGFVIMGARDGSSSLVRLWE